MSTTVKASAGMSRQLTKALSLFLGVLMFMFGFLKFFQPFRGWFDIQIQQSHLPHEAILAGKLGEMVVGCLFLLPWLRKSSTARNRDQLLLIACSILVAEMGGGNLCPSTASSTC